MPNYSNEWIRAELLSLSEPDYKRFSASLIPNIDPNKILGVRFQKLRKIAQSLAKDDFQAYLNNASDDTFEEIMLQGMVIGCIKGTPAQILPLVKNFIPKIDNWSVCDSFCTSLKLAKSYPDEIWEFLAAYLTSDREYEIRFAVVMLLHYYITESYLNRVLSELDLIHKDTYYVKMAVAWAVSMCYIKFPHRVMPYLQSNHLDDFTYNKALQKIVESRQINADTKSIIRAMKRPSLNS